MFRTAGFPVKEYDSDKIERVLRLSREFIENAKCKTSVGEPIACVCPKISLKYLFCRRIGVFPQDMQRRGC